MQELVTLECTEAKKEGKPVSRYLTFRNKKTVTERIEKKKYNPHPDVRRRGVSGGGSGITLEDIEEAREQGYETAEQIGWRLGATRDAVQAIISRTNRLAS